uniref:Translocon-associated protein subunit gamma n=1 Tax=Parascaris univalens TaxID=6257 RepID=A0A915AS41_PARUN
MSKVSQKLSKEDELLLQDFSAAVSAKGSAMFYGISMVMSAAPLYLFYGIHQMEVADSWIVWLVSALVASYLISIAYKNVKHVLKHKVVVKRGDSVAREMNRKLADDKKMSKKEKDERILWKKNELAKFIGKGDEIGLTERQRLRKRSETSGVHQKESCITRGSGFYQWNAFREQMTGT